MATIDQLMAAFGAFGQAAQEYGATKGIQDATLAVQELKKNTELDYQQRIAAQGQIANQLQAGLAGLNAPQAQIAAAVGAVAPPKISSAADALALANNSTDPVERKALLDEYKVRAKNEGELELAQKKPLMQQEQTFAIERIEKQNELTAKAAAIKGTTSLTKEENQRLFEVSRQYEEKATPLRQAMRQAGTARELLSSGNPVGESAAINGLVKASGDTGVITEADREAFGGSKAYLARVSRAASQARSGKLDKESRQFLLQVADVFEKKQSRELENYADRFTGRVVNAVGVDKDRALSIVDPELYEKRKMQAKTSEAEAWARANPNDPRAKEILKRLGK